MSVTVSGNAEDPLGLNDSDSLTVAASGHDGTRTERRSVFGNRVIYSSPTGGYADHVAPTIGNVYGGEQQLWPFDPSPVSQGMKFRTLRDCRVVAIRFYKHPDLAGVIPVALFEFDPDVSGGTTPLSATTVTVVADNGGWVEVELDAPIDIVSGTSYIVAYLAPTPGNLVVFSPWVWNSQDYVAWPIEVDMGAGLNSPGVGLGWVGNSPSNTEFHNMYVDVVVEWDVTDPVYEGGTEYFDQWQTGGSRHAFPVAVFFADPPFLQEYYDDVGINTLIAGAVSDEYVAAIKATDGMDWIPAGGSEAATLVQIDPELSDIVRGYLLDDEPDLRTPYDSPTVLRGWHTGIRERDSTRPIYLGLSYNPVKNVGFTFLPVGAHVRISNQHWRDFAAEADVLSCDFYSLAANDSYNPSGDELAGSGPWRFGIWVYPIQIKRMMELNDKRTPVWGVVEATSEVPGKPVPGDVVKAVWSQLIAGARGIIFFDHRFASASVSQDFAALLHNAPMKAALTALIDQLQFLGPALHAPDANLIDGFDSSGVLASAWGGLAAGHTIPVHYTSRLAGGNSYIFAQVIRPGATTATLHVPSLAGAVMTVIGESRTVTIDGSGNLTDTFAADYSYHLYSTSSDPVTSAPNNTVAPVVTTDGTPVTGETVSCSTGTWTGVPTPTYTYQWRRGGANISGATASTYLLQVADEGTSVLCRVTATNSVGSDFEDSGVISPLAPGGGGGGPTYSEVVLDDDPVGYWHLTDLTDSSGSGLTLTEFGAPDVEASIVATDPGSGKARSMHNFPDGYQTVDDPSVMNFTAEVTVEAWVNFEGTFGGYPAEIVGHNVAWGLHIDGSQHITFSLGTSSGFFDAVGPVPTNGQTYHVVGTYDGAVVNLYLDGVLVDSVATVHSISLAADPVYISGKSTVTVGTVDEVAVYDHALTPDRIAIHYEAGSGEFTGIDPSDHGTPIAWFRPETLSGLTDGASVTTWPDSSPNTDDAVTSGSAPTYQTDELNGWPVVRFASQALAAATVANTQPNVIFAVMKYQIPTGTGDIYSVLVALGNAGVENSIFTDPTASPDDKISMWAGAALHDDLLIDWRNEWHIMEFIFDDGDSELILGGTTYKTGDAGSQNPAGGLTLGRLAGSPAVANVDIAEVIVFADLVDSTNRTAVREYLSAKYGIAIA